MTTLNFEVVILNLLRKTEYFLVFLLGGSVYMLLEISWRSYTHWSMGICGGICFLGIYIFQKKKPNCHFLLKCLFGSLFITSNEFITGFIVNILLGWNVWDYSRLPLNLLGQICIIYSLLWFLLSYPAFKIASLIKSNIFSYGKLIE